MAVDTTRNGSVNSKDIFYERMKTPNDVNSRTNEKFKYIINYLDRKDRDISSEGPPINTYSRLNELYETFCFHPLSKEYRNLELESGADRGMRLRAIKEIANTALSMEMGTCLEMAAVGFLGCLELSVQVEFAKVSDYNHFLLVFNRNQQSLANAYQEWGPDAVVCDPWANKVYPASEIPKQLQIYIGTELNHQDGTIRTLFKSYSEPNDRFSFLANTLLDK